MGDKEEELIKSFLQCMAKLQEFADNEWISIREVPVGEGPYLIDCIIVRKDHVKGELFKLAAAQKSGIGKHFGRIKNASVLIRGGLKAGAEIWLLEAKTSKEKLWEAIGQVLIYRELFLLYYPSTTINGTIIILPEITVDSSINEAIEKLAKKIGTIIKLYLYIENSSGTIIFRDYNKVDSTKIH